MSLLDQEILTRQRNELNKKIKASQKAARRQATQDELLKLANGGHSSEAAEVLKQREEKRIQEHSKMVERTQKNLQQLFKEPGVLRDLFDENFLSEIKAKKGIATITCLKAMADGRHDLAQAEISKIERILEKEQAEEKAKIKKGKSVLVNDSDGGPDPSRSGVLEKTTTSASPITVLGSLSASKMLDSDEGSPLSKAKPVAAAYMGLGSPTKMRVVDDKMSPKSGTSL